MNFGFIGSPVITMFHQLISSEIVTIVLKPVGILEYSQSVFFSESVFNGQRARLRLLHEGFFFVFCVYSSEKTISSVTTYGVQ